MTWPAEFRISISMSSGSEGMDACEAGSASGASLGSSSVDAPITSAPSAK